MRRPLDVTPVTRLADADALAAEWRALLARSAYAVPMRTPTWLLSWWRVFGDRRALRVLTVHDDGRLVGLAPLLRRVVRVHGVVPMRRIELLGTGEDEADEICSDYVGVLAEAGREREVADAVARAIASGVAGTWDEVVLSAMAADDPMVTPLAEAMAAQHSEASVAPFGSARFVPLPATWDGYLAALGGQRRYLVTRSLRDFAKWAGDDVVLREARAPAELAEGRRVLEALHGERWSADGRAGVFASERFSRFHALVMPKLLASARDPARDDGALELLWLTARGRPVAAAYNVAYRGHVCFYQSGRALDLPRGVRVGIVLHAMAIQRAIARGDREYDFLNGTAQYKAQLGLAERGLVTVRALALHRRAWALDATLRTLEVGKVAWSSVRAKGRRGEEVEEAKAASESELA